VLDEDECRVVLVPQTVQLLESDEAERLVERASSAVLVVRPRGTERLHLEVADAASPAPRLGCRDERAADTAAVQRTPNAQHVELRGPRRVPFDAQEADVRLDGEGE